jgi:hypothetical protein
MRPGRPLAPLLIEETKGHTDGVVDQDGDGQHKDMLPLSPDIENHAAQKQDKISGLSPGEEIGRPGTRQKEEKEDNRAEYHLNSPG